MFQEIISLENLLAAWYEFRKGKRMKPDVQQFERHLEDELFSLHFDLRDRRYRHGQYQQFHIFDPKHRVIHKATVRDRVVHHAIYRVLGPIFESQFIVDSCSCQTGKGTHRAVRQLERYVRSVSDRYREPCWVLKCDVRKFFDCIDHVTLLSLVRRRVSDSDVTWLLTEIVKSFSVDKNEERERESYRSSDRKFDVATLCKFVS